MWPHQQEIAYLVTLTEKILTSKLIFLYSVARFSTALHWSQGIVSNPSYSCSVVTIFFLFFCFWRKIVNLAIHNDKFFSKMIYIFLDFKLLKTSCIFQELTHTQNIYNLQNINCQNQNSFCLKISIFCYVIRFKCANLCVYIFANFPNFSRFHKIK